MFTVGAGAGGVKNYYIYISGDSDMLNIIFKDIQDIKPYENNPRKNDK